jgi:hypothetical protein
MVSEARGIARVGSVRVGLDKFSTIRSIKLSYKIDQVENGWTVTTMDGTVFVFPDAKEMAEWFCMVVGVPFQYRKTELDPLEEEIRKLTKQTASLLA